MISRFPSGPVGTLLLAGALSLVALAAGGAETSLRAQTATVTTEENFRAEPNGVRLGRVQPGTVLGVAATEGQWVQATLTGWMWNPSLQETDRQGFDLEVSSDGGENLRVEPQGTVLARLEEGALLEEIERGDDWTRVRRTAWIWRPSVSLDEGVSASEPGGTGGGATPVDGWRTVGADGAAILTAPDGDTLARSASGTEVRVLGRQGNWARVQLEGWTWMPEAAAGAPADTTVLTDVGPEAVARNPDAYRGRMVSWELQFISREEAEPVRTDFYEGEPYLLTRAAEESSRFVYVAVPPEGMEDVESLMPLERIVVVGRIRTGSAALTGGPILDLLELSRVGSSGNGG